MATIFAKYKHVFSDLTSQILMTLQVDQFNSKKFNFTLDELNSLDYKSHCFVSTTDANKIIHVICSNKRTYDEFTSAKISHLINHLITKQKVELDSRQVHEVFYWLLKSIKHSSDAVLIDYLQTLQIVLQYCIPHVFQFNEELIGPNGIILNLIRNRGILNPDQKNLCQHLSFEATLLSLKCLQLLTTHSNEPNMQLSNEVLNDCTKVVIELLYSGFQKGQDHVNYCKVVIYGLRVLSQIYMFTDDIEKPLPDLVGLGRSFLVYGLDKHLPTSPKKVNASQQVIAEPASAPSHHHIVAGKKKKVRKQRNSAVVGLRKDKPLLDKSLNKDINPMPAKSGYNSMYTTSLVSTSREQYKGSWNITSDSDISDSESGLEAKLRALRGRVRLGAQNLLLVLIEVTEQMEMFGYWWALLPDSPRADIWDKDESCKRTLAYCAAKDPLNAGRSGALSVILALLSGSRMYLSQAEMSKQTVTSFTPFSITLGHVITCLHKVLTDILGSERTSTVIAPALKCAAALIQATPYHRLQPVLLCDLVKVARKFLVHKDFTVQAAALIITGCVLSIDPVVDDVLKSIAKDEECMLTLKDKVKMETVDNQDDDFEEDYPDDEIFMLKPISKQNKSSDTGIPQHIFKTWILDVCFRNLGWMVKGTVISKCDIASLPVCLESLQVLSAMAFHHFPSLMQEHLVLLADILCDTLNSKHGEILKQATKCVESVGDAIQKLEQTQQPLPPLQDCICFWNKLLCGPLTAALQHEGTHPAKAYVCDCIANIGERVFKELPQNRRVFCITLLFGACADEDLLVRGAAVRSLAMLVVYKNLREDIGFVTDCAESILRVLDEPMVAVRIKSTWSLSNLSDALVLNLNDHETDRLDDALLLRIMETCIQCTKENDKIKMNSTRTLGNLLRLITEDNLEKSDKLKLLTEKSISKLIDCASVVSNMRIRWNSCYALGNAMKNEVLFRCVNGWQAKVFSCLCNLALDCKNLKVRINAIVALRSAKSRTHYGESFISVWAGILAAMENAGNVDDFSEYKHKDNLIEQLCVTLSHLCCLLTVADMSDIMDPLCFHYDSAKTLFTQLSKRLLPANGSCTYILEAAKYVTVNLNADNKSQRQVLAMLQDIFIWET